jgi:mannosyltransferase OCH1-like enzyme
MIPKVLHHIWIGGPLPEHLDGYVDTWRDHHPGWDHIMWSNFDWLQNQYFYDHADEITPHVGQFRADLARYEILHRHGGVYVDCDFECRRPLDELIDRLDAFAAWETDDVWVNNAIIGARAGHGALARVILSIPMNVALNRGKRPNVMTGPQLLTPIWRRSTATTFPSALFYPYRWDELDRRDEDFPDAYAVHHWENARKRAA